MGKGWGQYDKKLRFKVDYDNYVHAFYLHVCKQRGSVFLSL